MERWYRLMNRAAFLNQDAPWMYDDRWYNAFVDEMNHITYLLDAEFDEELTKWEEILFN